MVIFFSVNYQWAVSWESAHACMGFTLDSMLGFRKPPPVFLQICVRNSDLACVLPLVWVILRRSFRVGPAV